MIETTLTSAAARPALPAGWRWAPLGDVCSAIRGVTFSSGEARRDAFEGAIACLTTSGVQGAVKWQSRTFIPRSRMSSIDQVLRPGDLLVSTANSKALVGKSCMVSEPPFEATFGAFVTVLRPRADTDAAYLSYWMRSNDALAYCYETSSNTTNISNLRTSDLLALRLPLPPLHEQRRIAAILREQMAAVERARSAAEAQLAAAQALPAAYLRAVFESDEAREWAEITLGEVLRLRKEIVHPSDRPVGQATFVGLEHIESGTGVRTGCLDVQMEKLTGRKPRFYAGDIVYGYLRPYLNKVWVAEFDGLCSVDQYVYAVLPNVADTQYVAWFMRSPTYLARAPITSSPGQLPRIRTEEVSSVAINLPPVNEQRRIVAVLDSQMSASGRARRALEAQIDAINQLPAALLRQAFSGEL